MLQQPRHPADHHGFGGVLSGARHIPEDARADAQGVDRSSKLTVSGGGGRCWCRGGWTVLDGAERLVELLRLGDRPPVQLVGLLPQLGGGGRVPLIGVPQHPGRMLRHPHRIIRARGLRRRRRRSSSASSRVARIVLCRRRHRLVSPASSVSSASFASSASSASAFASGPGLRGAPRTQSCRRARRSDRPAAAALARSRISFTSFSVRPSQPNNDISPRTPHLLLRVSRQDHANLVRVQPHRSLLHFHSIEGPIYRPASQCPPKICARGCGRPDILSPRDPERVRARGQAAACNDAPAMPHPLTTILGPRLEDAAGPLRGP
jgi:hypothetical protein